MYQETGRYSLRPESVLFDRRVALLADCRHSVIVVHSAQAAVHWFADRYRDLFQALKVILKE